MATAPPLLQARGLGFRYSSRTVLEAVDLDLAAGTCTWIRGDNGAGKSTLLQLLQGRLQPCSGWVKLAGRPLQGQRRRVALVPQTASVRWHYPIDLGHLVALASGKNPRRTHSALEVLGLAALASVPVANLSGGQQQRALIARALAQDADVLLLDEPLSHLDGDSRLQLGSLLSHLSATGTAIVLTAHGELPESLGQLKQLHLQQGRLKPNPPNPGA
ncbi:MAG: ATP-binding cassette domain-containing protein [Prochlorococcaceae cyanobacterium]